MTTQGRKVADVIFHGGRVITCAEDAAVHQAVAVRGDFIQAVGRDTDVMALAEAGTTRINLRGRTLIPGIIDTHAHMDREGLKRISPSLEGSRSIDDILEVIRQEAAGKRPGEWVVTMPIGNPPNYTDVPDCLQEKRFPNRWDLDRVSPHNPVYIRGIWTPWNVPPSVSVANSVALQRAGITRDTQSPHSSVTIERDASGEPTGVFFDQGRYPSVEFTLMKAVPRFTHAQRVAALKESMRLYNAAGTTGTYEGHGIAPELLRVYKEVWDAGECTVRAHLTLSPAWRSVREAEREMERWGHSASGSGFGDDMLRISGYFIQYRGLPYTARARSAELPFTGWAGFAESYNSPARFRQLIGLAAKHNLRVNTLVRGHMEHVLQAFEDVHRETPIDQKRWVLVHILDASTDQLRRIRQMGLVVETIPLTDLWLRGSLYAGMARAGSPDAHQTYLEHGVRFGFGTDNKPYKPFETLWAVVARKERTSGAVIAPEERMSRLGALKSFTGGGAYFCFDEQRRGSIEPGKLADLVVLSDDILNMPEDEIPNVHSLFTMVGGKVVHQTGNL